MNRDSSTGCMRKIKQRLEQTFLKYSVLRFGTTDELVVPDGPAQGCLGRPSEVQRPLTIGSWRILMNWHEVRCFYKHVAACTVFCWKMEKAFYHSTAL